jgi:hypothetical protein
VFNVNQSAKEDDEDADEEEDEGKKKSKKKGVTKGNIAAILNSAQYKRLLEFFA